MKGGIGLVRRIAEYDSAWHRVVVLTRQHVLRLMKRDTYRPTEALPNH